MLLEHKKAFFKKTAHKKPAHKNRLIILAAACYLPNLCILE
jgi:hypothetical protein